MLNSYNPHQDIYACSWIWFCFRWVGAILFFFSTLLYISRKGHEIYAFHMFLNDKMMEHNCIVLSDVFQTHTLAIALTLARAQFHTFATFNDFFLSAILFIVFVVIWNENFGPFELSPHRRATSIQRLTFSVVRLAFHGNAVFSSLYFFYDRHPSTL